MYVDLPSRTVRGSERDAKGSGMTRRTRIWPVAVLVGLVAVALPVDVPGAPPAAVAVAADGPDHVVHAGAKDPTDPLSISMFETYFPRQLRVHRGDWVRWEFPNQANGAQAFHTVTFGDPGSAPYARADEVEGALVFSERAFFTTGCGRAGQPICEITSVNQFVSSGTPIQHSAGVGRIQPFDAVINLPEGNYNYFCTLHHPTMQGSVAVVADDVVLDNPDPSDFAGAIAAAATQAKATFADEANPSLSIENGRRVWTVDAGTRTTGDIPVSTEAFLPGSLNVRPGDTVRWVMGGTAHAVTFPDATQGKGPPLHLTLNCEVDAPAAGAPGVPAIAIVGAVGLPWCPPGGTMEMAFSPLAARESRAPDDAVVPGAVHNSGIMIAAALPDRMRGRPAGSGQVFPSEFEATFPVPGTYTYRCMIHWEFMGGSITVGQG